MYKAGLFEPLIHVLTDALSCANPTKCRQTAKLHNHLYRIALRCRFISVAYTIYSVCLLTQTLRVVRPDSIRAIHRRLLYKLGHDWTVLEK